MAEYTRTQRIGLILGPVLFIIMCLIGPFEGMKPAAQYVAAATLLMAVWWITEAVPIPATALLPIILYPFFEVMKIGQVTAQYGNPTIYLFMGGFFVAVTMEKWNLHRRIALHTIKLVGTSPAKMTLGFMIATGFLSMWVSNTATAMMMVPIGLAVITQVSGIAPSELMSSSDKRQSNFAKALMLSIAYAASIGGLATIIGTPPNAIMVGMVNAQYGQNISFLDWFIIGLPIAIVVTAISWFLLTKILFPTKDLTLANGKEVIVNELEKMGKITKQEKVVLCVFLLVGILWIFVPQIKKVIPGMNDSLVAILGAMLLFMIPSDLKKGEFILDWKTAVKIPWDIVLLFGGGFAVAKGFETSGLAAFIASKLELLAGVPLFLLILIIAFFVLLLTEVTSNTATATLLIPIMGATAVAVGVHPYALILTSTLSASLAFMMPVATPPNAVVFASGVMKIKDMLYGGFLIGIICIFITTIFIVCIVPLLWGIDIGSTPAWATQATEQMLK